MNYSNEVKRFEKSFRLHASRYHLYSEETTVKGATGTHNRAVTALGNLEAKVVANPSLYEDLLFELLQDSDPKVVLFAGFFCLEANLYTDKAIETLVHIARNTPGISMICTFDISGTIQRFKKRQLDARPRNEVDAIAELMKSGEATDEEIWELISKLPEIDMRGHDERTALVHACIFNRFMLAQKMVEQGADVNWKDETLKTVLHCAAVGGNPAIVALLLDHQADVNAPQNKGFTALDFAMGNQLQLPKEQLDQLIDILRSHGAKTKHEIVSEH